jgi:protein-tyrosine phosphatase
MIDIHSHVLPGLDDGSQTLENSVTMLEMAAAAGTTDIVATPHANTEFRFDPAAIESKLTELRGRIGNKIRLYSGCDFHLMSENIQDALAHPTKYTINHKNWLLVEFSDFIIFPNTAELLAHLREGGMLPVITHPERNQIIQNRFNDLQKWVQEGAFVQLTAVSLLGTFGQAARRFSQQLIEAELAHFVASDAHDTDYRTTRLDTAYEWLSKNYGEEYARAVTVDNPSATIEGRPCISTPAPKKRKRFLGVF